MATDMIDALVRQIAALRGRVALLEHQESQLTPPGSIHHGGLVGLADDDHPQYVLEAACHVYNSANISIGTGAWATLTFDAERFDTDTMHSLVGNTDRITFTTAGLYFVFGAVSWAANAVGVRCIQIIRNAGANALAYQEQTNTGALAHIQSCLTLYQMAATDYVQLQVYQASGGNLNVNARPNFSPMFMAHRIG